jgi:hypothetical protein
MLSCLLVESEAAGLDSMKFKTQRKYFNGGKDRTITIRDVIRDGDGFKA